MLQEIVFAFIKQFYNIFQIIICIRVEEKFNHVTVRSNIKFIVILKLNLIFIILLFKYFFFLSEEES
jgi:hypothetical protein